MLLIVTVVLVIGMAPTQAVTFQMAIDEVHKGVALYNGAFDVMYLGLSDTLSLLMIASLLGVIGSWIVLRQQLKQIKPE